MREQHGEFCLDERGPEGSREPSLLSVSSKRGCFAPIRFLRHCPGSTAQRQVQTVANA